MNRIFTFFNKRHTIPAIGLLFSLVALYLMASAFHLPTGWMMALLLITSLACVLYWYLHWQRSRRASQSMEQAFHTTTAEAIKKAAWDRKPDVEIIRQRLLDALQKIKGSKLGQTTGSSALYEMPWYVLIGNPAAGKSTAILNSGLNFPFSDKGSQAVQGIGGTRNCDWFFTTEGILLDTAGRYAVHEEDRSEWLGFLGLLKKYRPKAPINGIVIVASIAELTGNGADFNIHLAKQLRQRVQEITERLELFPPVYVMFTKVDLIAGFVDFFDDSDAEERSRVWGATLAYDQNGKAKATALFDQHFDMLVNGIQELGTTRMALNPEQTFSPGVLAFPLEFAGIKRHLRPFIATLFEENPFQFSPLFRGFYFTSALQEGVATDATGQRLIAQYRLSAGPGMTASISSNTGFFLKNLFSSVIFPDRELMRQYASRTKLLSRQLIFCSAVLLLGLLLGGWSWSLISNRHYVASIQADLDKIVKSQENNVDLASRLEALGILQDRLEQLHRYHAEKPLSLSFGLYQGERIENKLRSEYFQGLRQVMLTPVTANLEAFLSDVQSNTGKLASGAGAFPTADIATLPLPPTVQITLSPYKELSSTNPEDAYNALKTYLMLANRERIETPHLRDQITRFWRVWLDDNRGTASRERIIRHAEKLITFYLAQAEEPDFPLIENRVTLVEQVRQTLHAAIKETPARERVYSEIKRRAATRFPVMSVAAIVGEQNKEVIAGSHAISGTFTRVVWEQFVEGAIKEASTKELQSVDWVLKISARNDLTLEGSPEKIQQELVRMYKAEYISEWKKFMQGITIPDFASFDKAVTSLSRLGDPVSSPIDALVKTLYRETSWDNPAALQQGSKDTRQGTIGWLRETVLRQPSSRMLENTPSAKNESTFSGVISKEFSAIANLASPLDKNREATLMHGYLTHLSKVRSRFNQIRNAGDIGPGSRQLMHATLEGSQSELADALKYVDDSMLTGMPDSERVTIRPLLVRPVMQAFSVLVSPVEQELNRTWTAQVFDPFNKSIAMKYPFAPTSRTEATAAEIALFFGPEGSIAKFVQSTIGPLVIQRGDTLSVRSWAEMGISLHPAFVNKLTRFVAPQAITGATSTAASEGTAQTHFQLQPVPTPGLVEFTIEIDGQILHYRNGKQQWVNFTWPFTQGQPGARISAMTPEGRLIEIANHPGQSGLEQLINSAQRKKLEQGLFMMTWSSNGYAVSTHFRISSESTPKNSISGPPSETGLRGLKLPAVIAGRDS